MFILEVLAGFLEIEFKGALDDFSLISQFFKKVEIFISQEVYTFVVTAWLILLAASTWLHRYLIFIFLQKPFLKVDFQK